MSEPVASQEVEKLSAQTQSGVMNCNFCIWEAGQVFVASNVDVGVTVPVSPIL